MDISADISRNLDRILEEEGDRTQRSNVHDDDSIWRLPNVALPWISVPAPRLERATTFLKGDGFDLYIDAARFLPDNVTLSSVEAFMTDRDNNVYGRLQKDIDPRTRAVSCPVYNGRKEFRTSERRPWDPTAILVFRIDALEHVGANARRETRLGVVGFAAMNVFVDAETGQTPQKSAREYVLNAGSFQLSVHRSGVPEVHPENRNLLDDAPRTTCSTLLVRILQAPYALNGLKVLSAISTSPAPDRGGQTVASNNATPVPNDSGGDMTRVEGLNEARLTQLGLLVLSNGYASTRYSNEGISDPTVLEQKVYPLRARAAELNAKSALKTLIQHSEMEGLHQGLLQQHPLQRTHASELARTHASELAQALKDVSYYHVQNFPPLVKEVARMIKAILKSARTKLGTEGPAFVDVNSSISYSTELGFNLAVDGLDNFPPVLSYSGLYVLASLFPPGLIYRSNGQIQNDITYYHALNYSSEVTRPRFVDGLQRIGTAVDEVMTNAAHYVVLDVRCLLTGYEVKGTLGTKAKTLPSPEPAGLGFAIVPALVMGPLGRYTMSANYRLPIYATGSSSWTKNPTKGVKDDKEFARWLRQGAGPPQALLDQLAGIDTDIDDNTLPDLQETLKRSEASGLIHLIPGVSLLCRISDGARDGDFSVAFGEQTEPHRVKNYCPSGTEMQYRRNKGKSHSIVNKLGDLRTSTNVHRADTFEIFLCASTLKCSQKESSEGPL